MSPTISMQEAQATLPEIIQKLAPGEEMVITQDNRPVAKLIGQQQATRRPRQPDSAKGVLLINVDDDEHLKDFEEYMP